ncbi:MAG: hypothetical protein ABW328_04700 [Ilumatobacteraceae bacterium]
MHFPHLFRFRSRPSLRDWWAYFGSFGDDLFGDEHDDDLQADDQVWSTS